MDFLWQDMMHATFWFAALQIIGVNIILSGDNAVVIAMACMTLPPRQRLWGMVLGAGVALRLARSERNPQAETPHSLGRQRVGELRGRA